MTPPNPPWSQWDSCRPLVLGPGTPRSYPSAPAPSPLGGRPPVRRSRVVDTGQGRPGPTVGRGEGRQGRVVRQTSEAPERREGVVGRRAVDGPLDPGRLSREGTGEYPGFLSRVVSVEVTPLANRPDLRPSRVKYRLLYLRDPLVERRPRLSRQRVGTQ